MLLFFAAALAQDVAPDPPTTGAAPTPGVAPAPEVAPLTAPVAEPPVLAQIDWQGHPAMHKTWGFFAPGLTERSPKLTWNHTFQQAVYAPYLAKSGVRIFLTAAMAAEQARNPTQARQMILDSFAYVEAFAAAHSDRYALAKTPAEARQILRDTDKMVLIHSIEGGHLLLDDPADAAFWRDQGVALVTLMHLRDDELGGSAILPRKLGPLINAAGAKHNRKGERRGLTTLGADAIRQLGASGILVDLTHMHPDTVDDALAVTAAAGMSPVVTHGALASLRKTEMAFRDDQVIEVYRQGGIFALGLTGHHLDPLGVDAPAFADVCPGTVESFQAHYEAVNTLVQAHRAEIPGAEDPVRLAVGWSSDWNGWVPHSQPVYGPGRCRALDTLAPPLEIDTRGLAHPGLLPEQWAVMERRGADLQPMLRSAERFLQLWEAARGER